MPGWPAPGRDVRRELRLIHIGARVDDAGHARDVERQARCRAEYRVLDRVLQQVAVTEQARGREQGVGAAGGRLYHARNRGAALDD